MRGPALAAALAALATPALAIPPPPPPGVEIDCSRTSYASEKLICGDPELMRREATTTALYRQTADVLPPAARGVLETGQLAWMRERNLCAFKADGRGCVLAQYAAREAALKALTAR